MRQLNFGFMDAPPPRRKAKGRTPLVAPPTHAHPNSMAAADLIAGPAAGSLRQQVLAFIAARGDEGATRNEIEQGTTIRHQTINPRIAELSKAGLIRESGRTRPTSSGRKAAVWVRVAG